MTIQPINGVQTVTLSGVNFQVINGRGLTESINGAGNIIIGYDEANRLTDQSYCSLDRNAAGTLLEDGQRRASRPAAYSARSTNQGSHNLIVGSQNNYASAGAIVAGKQQHQQRALRLRAGRRAQSLEQLPGHRGRRPGKHCARQQFHRGGRQLQYHARPTCDAVRRTTRNCQRRRILDCRRRSERRFGQCERRSPAARKIPLRASSPSWSAVCATTPRRTPALFSEARRARSTTTPAPFRRSRHEEAPGQRPEGRGDRISRGALECLWWWLWR